MQQDVLKKRIILICILVALGSMIFVAKLVYVQLFKGDLYAQMAERQYITNPQSLFNRGSIFVRSKENDLVSVATTRSGFKVALNARTLQDKDQVYESIGELLGITREQFDRFASRNSAYQEIATQLDQETAQIISELEIPSISVHRANYRWYPAKDLASHAVGFMAFRENDFIGRYGLERFYEKTLARTDQGLYVNFFAEVFSDIKNLLKDASETEGDIVTTIEPQVQQNLELAVKTAREKWDADRVGGIIMDAHTGAIYAMALDNGFDLNTTRTTTDISQFNNPLIESVFEPGSTMKPIIAALALEQGVITPATEFFDQGFVKVGDKVINNFDKRGRGQVTMQQVLNDSLNTGMVFMMQKMNKQKFKENWLAFGFGEKTSIDLPGEVNNIISNINTNRDVEYANISFGQGVALTPITMARATAVLANGGKLVQPHMVSEIRYLSGITKKITHEAHQGIIRPETSQIITSMLVKTFDSYSQGKYKMDNYAIAAKTGTAQMANPRGGYYTDRNLHTFVGYFPAYNPRFVIFLYNEFPKNGARFASETLLPPFVDFAKFMVSYYNLPPDR
jgi:cell division protein FtsI/penicillin-binding protein 2